MLHSLTDKQRHAFMTIAAVRDAKKKRLLEDYPGCTPSEWTSIDELVRIHRVHKGAINSLLKKGYLEVRPSDGWGPEVRITPTEV